MTTPKTESNGPYNVERYSRGMNGRFFGFGAAATIHSKVGAVDYAKELAAELKADGVSGEGTHIRVLSRRVFEGEYGPTNIVDTIYLN